MTYKSRREPFSKQLVALENAKGKKAFAYLMEMGTGKTKVIIDEWGQLSTDLDLLVIAPKGVYRNWEMEIANDLDPKVYKNTAIVHWVSGAGKQHREFIRNFLLIRGKPRVLLINAEALSTIEEARWLCEQFLKQRPTMMVVDESTLIKSHKAKRTKTILALGKLAAMRRIATGTPSPNSPLDIYCQFEFLDPSILGFNSYWAFRARYAIMRKMDFGGRRVDIVVGYRNTEELQHKIAAHSYRVLKEDCLDLPPKVYMPLRHVEMTDEQAEMYRNMKRFATAEFDGSHVTATAVITQMLRLHQILCGHTMSEQGQVFPIPSRRVDALLELLEEAGDKVIIWANYRYSLHEIATRLRKEYNTDRVVEYWGATTDKEREEAKQRFQEDPNCKYFIGNPQTGGRGITLTAARHVVYYSNTHDLELREQSEDRAHRAGLKHSVDYTDLCVAGSVDERIIKSLRAKINIATTITGDNYREWII